MKPFWSWLPASEDTENRAVLVLSGPIDTGKSWYEDAVYPAMLREQLAQHAGEDIFVEINSPGGDVFAGFEIYNMLLSHTGSVRVRVVGMAASAASLVAMAADKGEMLMAQASMMMIHNPWTYAAGNSDALREQADVLDMITDVMVGVYSRRFNAGEEELRRMLSEETYLTPARAQALGLCDAIDAPEGAQETDAAAAAAMFGRYAAMSRADMAALRARFGAAPPQQEAKTAPACDAQTASRLLAEADALIAAAFA